MATTKFKKKDLNRIKKVYPYIRKKPVWGLLSDKELVIEAGAVLFEDVDNMLYKFDSNFDGVPAITAIAVDTEDNNISNVNVYVSSLTNKSMILNASCAFTGKVHFHAIYIKE